MDESSENNLEVVAIVGLGGLGKTTLAQLVYNDGLVYHIFDQRIWVYVSQKFDTKSIIRSIIESVTKMKCTLPDSMDLLQQALVEQIGCRKLLLVLDDVWNEDYESWDGLRSLLNKGGRGSKVIATTRSTRVASIMGAEKLHLLTPLSDYDSWLLFKRWAFELDSNANSQNLVAIGKEIVKKCRGVPLAVKALGRLMRFKREVSQWLAIRDNGIRRLVDDDDVVEIYEQDYEALLREHVRSQAESASERYCESPPSPLQLQQKDHGEPSRNHDQADDISSEQIMPMPRTTSVSGETQPLNDQVAIQNPSLQFHQTDHGEPSRNHDQADDVSFEQIMPIPSVSG